MDQNLNLELTPPAVVFDEVTYGYVPWSTSRSEPCAPSNIMFLPFLRSAMKFSQLHQSLMVQSLSRHWSQSASTSSTLTASTPKNESTGSYGTQEASSS